jgi:hypothetical protein
MTSKHTKLNIKQYKNITSSIEEYFNSYLFNIKQHNMTNKKLFIIKKEGSNNIIGSFFIDTQYNILETLYIVEVERGKGYCSQIINYLKNNYKELYFDVYYDNITANKCYSKYLHYIGIISHNMFKKIYGYMPIKNIKILRYGLHS